MKLAFKKCKLCNSEFSYKLSLKRDVNKQYCSRKCSSKNNGLQNKDRKHSVEVNLKKGLKGVKNGFYGKKHSEKSKLKMSNSSLFTPDKFKYCYLSNTEKEIFDGLLLSDGHLAKKSRISARLTFGFKHKQVINDIIDNMPSIDFSNIYEDVKTKCYHLKSKSYYDFLIEQMRWYPKAKKIIPKNILITKKSCYWWFIGDGYNSRGNVFLCTDSYDKTDNMFLIEKLNNYGFNPSLTSKNRLRFNKKETINFLEWIMPMNGVMECYKYKWKI
jgi:hypothetical protein